MRSVLILREGGFSAGQKTEKVLKEARIFQRLIFQPVLFFNLPHQV
jgi:hypothetical protein